ncbi:MAG: J domain-containing protein [Pleurocapsa minor GSE-CHR-MK-17-07R]|jgi:hypothetical protein|nr:J domain-containing protein [Pleurocapsa minor GSE-CHR-MK 17-07R]
MGNIRYETSFASAWFVDLLRASGRLGRMLHNGVDIVLFQLTTGQQVSAHFIDSALPLYEIRGVLADNASRNIATLYVLWADMMLPSDGQLYVPDDWMEGLFTLYNSSIYAYEIYSNEAYIFPVHFRGEGVRRLAQFGSTVSFAGLGARRVKTHLPGLHGEWLVADFGGISGTAHDDLREQAGQSRLSEQYALLGLAPGASALEIRSAYRHLARRFHPDLNAEAEANEAMLKLNAAYESLLRALDEQANA